MPIPPLEVFISYAHEDQALKDELSKHLSNLRRQGLIKTWHDGNIVPGTEWEQQIIEHLTSAQLILLLISKDFMASDFCFSVEMQQAMARHQTNQARVIPILVRQTDWQDAPFSILQMLPTGAKPVVNWSRRDDAFSDVVNGIRKAIEDVKGNAATLSRVADTTSVESIPMPLWNVPYRRNPYFTGQEAILKYLHTTLKTDKAAALTQPQAISGLGGIGKTQIALEYAYRHRQTYRAIMWMQADTREALILGFISLANLLQLPQKDAQDQNVIVEAVKDWLETHEQWLLILDNADDLMLLDEFLPTRSAGHMLLTTRAQAQGLLAHAIEVEQMEPAEAALLLLRRAKVLAPDAPLEEATPAEQINAKEGAQVLGGLPLALDQAGAYIEETGCGVSGYLKRYHAHRFNLLKRRGSQVKDHPEPVATTWSLSFEKIEQSHPTAADLLRLCAFFHPDNIPEEFLSEGAPSFIPSLKSLAGNLIALDEAIEALRIYSLIRRHPETNTLSIHRLVQAVLKDTMKKAHQRLWAKRAIGTVIQVFPEANVDNWPVCERYILHAQSCVSLISQWNFTFEATTLLHLTGWYLQDRLEYEESEHLYQHALTINEQIHGANHDTTITILNNLAHVYWQQGKYAEAEPLWQRALIRDEQILGADHPDTALSLNNLALLYHAQGKYEEAEPLWQRALAICEQVLGANHPTTALSLNNLAELYRTQGKYEEAEPLLQRALAIYEQVLGADHPTTVTVRNNYTISRWEMQTRSK